MSTTATALLPDFRTCFPEYSGESDATVTKWIDTALCIFALSDQATIYLAAHLLTLANESGMGGSGATVDGGEGETVSESAGGVSASFKGQADSGDDTFFTSTIYGRTYLTLRNACPGYAFTPRVV